MGPLRGQSNGKRPFAQAQLRAPIKRRVETEVCARRVRCDRRAGREGFAADGDADAAGAAALSGRLRADRNGSDWPYEVNRPAVTGDLP